MPYRRIVLAAVVTLVLNVLCTVLYMVVYGEVIDRGHPQAYYEAHVQRAGPWLSILFGAPLMYAACRWLLRHVTPAATWGAVLRVWLVYVAIDFAIMLGSGQLRTAGSAALAVVTLSQIAKLGAAWIAVRVGTPGVRTA